MPKKNVVEPEVATRAWNVAIEIQPWEDGGYVARALALQGCWVVAPTIAEALRDLPEVIEMSISSRLKHGEPLPDELEEIPQQVVSLRLRVPVSLSATRARAISVKSG